MTENGEPKSETATNTIKPEKATAAHRTGGRRQFPILRDGIDLAEGIADLGIDVAEGILSGGAAEARSVLSHLRRAVGRAGNNLRGSL